MANTIDNYIRVYGPKEALESFAKKNKLQVLERFDLNIAFGEEKDISIPDNIYEDTAEVDLICEEYIKLFVRSKNYAPKNWLRFLSTTYPKLMFSMVASDILSGSCWLSKAYQGQLFNGFFKFGWKDHGDYVVDNQFLELEEVLFRFISEQLVNKIDDPDDQILLNLQVIGKEAELLEFKSKVLTAGAIETEISRPRFSIVSAIPIDIAEQGVSDSDYWNSEFSSITFKEKSKNCFEFNCTCTNSFPSSWFKQLVLNNPNLDFITTLSNQERNKGSVGLGSNGVWNMHRVDMLSLYPLSDGEQDVLRNWRTLMLDLLFKNRRNNKNRYTF